MSGSNGGVERDACHRALTLKPQWNVGYLRYSAYSSNGESSVPMLHFIESMAEEIESATILNLFSLSLIKCREPNTSRAEVRHHPRESCQCLFK